MGNLAEVIKVNSLVMYDQHAGHDIEYDDVMYRVIRLRDVVLVDEENKDRKSTRLNSSH